MPMGLAAATFSWAWLLPSSGTFVYLCIVLCLNLGLGEGGRQQAFVKHFLRLLKSFVITAARFFSACLILSAIPLRFFPLFPSF